MHAFLGVELELPEPGRALGHLRQRPEFVGDPSRPALHGGVLALLADGAAGAALISRIGRSDRLSTIDLRIDYLRPAAPADLMCEARVVRLGGRVGVVRVRVWQELGQDGEHVDVAEVVTAYSLRRRNDES